MALSQRRLLLLLDIIVLIAIVWVSHVSCQEGKEPLVPKCPSPEDPLEDNGPTSFCECISKKSRSGLTVSIKCDFNNTEHVILTEALYPFRNASLVSAYVRIVNATMVNVTQAFLLELMQSPSIAVDIWKANTLLLDSMPEPDNLEQFQQYKTFVGVGIVSCFVPEVPKKFLRDRSRGALRIKSSRVGNFHEGVLHNMHEMRYLVFEDSTVDFVEGSVASEGYVTLSKRVLHSWNGLLLSNVTIDTINSGAFNLTHKSDMEVAVVKNSKVGSINTGALVITGDIAVTIKDNVFQRIESEAFKVSVTGDVVFDENVIESWEPDALEGLICHNRTSMEKNTFHVPNPMDIAINVSATPFHTSCGNPQLFMVITPEHPVSMMITTASSWSIGIALLILIIIVVVGAVCAHQRQDLMMHYYRNRGRPLMGFLERKASRENLPNGAEIPDSSAEVAEEGMANPVYVQVQEEEEEEDAGEKQAS